MSSESDVLFGKTNVRLEHIQQAFREYFQDQDLSVNVDKADKMAIGQGMTSNMLRLTLKWTAAGGQKPTDLPRTVILKDPAPKAMDDLRRNMALEQCSNQNDHLMNKAHDGECFLYQTFQQHGLAPVPVPLVYGAWNSLAGTITTSDNRTPMILMEDLGGKACCLGDATNYINYEQFKSVIACLTDVQAWSLRNPQLLDGFEDVEQRYVCFKDFEPVMVNGMKTLQAAQPAVFESLDENKLIGYIRHENMVRMYKEQEQRFPTVLVHGDFYANNFMFEKLPDGSMGAKIVAFIDWQMAMKGSISLDFSRVVSINCSPELHEQKYEELKRYYFDLLTQKIGRDNMPKQLNYKALSEVLDETLAQNFLMMLFMQAILMESYVSGDEPAEAERKRQRIRSRCEYAMKFSSKFLDITK